MIKIFYIVLLTFICADLTAQVYYDGTSAAFEPEIKTFLVQVDKNPSYEMRFKFKTRSIFNGGIDYRDKMKYHFLNDSIMQQETIDGTYYGLIRNNKLFEYDIDKKNVITNPNLSVIDSSDCTISIQRFINKDDTIIWREISKNKKDSLDRIVESVTFRGSKPLNKFDCLIQGDSVESTMFYLYNDKSKYWKLTSTRLEIKSRLPNDQILKDSCVTSNFENESDKPIIYITLTKYHYNRKKMLDSIKKFEYFGETKAWINTHSLKIKYRKYNRA